MIKLGIDLLICYLGPPVINVGKSTISGTRIFLVWTLPTPSDSVDNFVIEMSCVHRQKTQKIKERFKPIYTGRKTYHEIKGISYNTKVVCRMYAVNFMGKSNPSDTLQGYTARGIFYN